jgi:hypothetical protein
MPSDIQSELNDIFEALAGGMTGEGIAPTTGTATEGAAVPTAIPDLAQANPAAVPTAIPDLAQASPAAVPTAVAEVAPASPAAAPTAIPDLASVYPAAIGGAMAVSAEVQNPLSSTDSVLGAALQGILTPSSSSSSSSASSTSTSGGGIGDTLESVGLDVLKSGFGIIPIVGSLLGLFGGGSDPLPTLTKYQMPASIDYTAAEVNGQIVGGDSNQTGGDRSFGGSPSSVATAATGITVNVQAMDSQSFLDHSADIAAAVRDAMLNLNSINDVVNEL